MVSHLQLEGAVSEHRPWEEETLLEPEGLPAGGQGAASVLRPGKHAASSRLTPSLGFSREASLSPKTTRSQTQPLMCAGGWVLQVLAFFPAVPPNLWDISSPTRD